VDTKGDRYTSLYHGITMNRCLLLIGLKSLNPGLKTFVSFALLFCCTEEIWGGGVFFDFGRGWLGC